MIDVKREGAVAIPKLPVKLTHIRDLEYYDGPRLSEFRSDHGETYLFKWCHCDREKDIGRWLVVRTINYIHDDKHSTIRETIVNCPDGFVYIVDITIPTDEDVAVYFMPVELVPDEYLPKRK